ncbi:helix-turn-helix domain-containing protein [Halobacterium zhouii]|uniref:helix-turn-helix domain-containing protein n=1 Tax=Halobacterium zhouii TaxID=2902624 RepID=UPI001E5F948B|nr:helix-turn-helix domain-containing protein [Halobacterium zhouii]
MTGSNSPTLRVSKGWEENDVSARNVAELKSILSTFTKNTDEMAELAFDGETPIVMRQAETGDMVVNVSAEYKSAAGSSSGSSSPESLTYNQVKGIFQQVDSPAVTTDEIADSLGCTQQEARYQLTELEHRGRIKRRKSGETFLWWPTENSHNGSLDTSSEAIKEGVRKSKEDIKEWAQENKREGESLQDAYDRIRGNPSFDTVKNLLLGEGNSESSMVEIMDSMENYEQSQKEDVKNMFDDS